MDGQMDRYKDKSSHRVACFAIDIKTYTYTFMPAKSGRGRTGA